ncbi:TNF receptor-associated factor 4-like [Montipora capricornis]|uniref:TNF receptor-associated factor 4-like n=1 Tax=Montipora capricornis TaxID=246305 RepID=UPI0035F148D9
MLSFAENVPELGGYDYEFLSNVPEDWECLVCHLTMKDPVQIVGCGHRVCNICMESLLRRPTPTCPADRHPLSRNKIFPDAACQRQILDLIVKCSYFGCSWKGELRVIEKHQSSCSLKVVPCPNSGCKERLTKQELTIHVAFECSLRETRCEYCATSFVYNQKQTHLATCVQFPVQCAKCGLRDIPRQKLEAHVRDKCHKTEVECEFKNLGCDAVFPRSDAKLHSESEVERHLALALRGLEATQHQVRALASLVRDQSQRLRRLEQMSEKYAPYVWKISHFQAVYDKAVSDEQKILESEAFYLSKSGYKMRIKILPNGGCADLGLNKTMKGNYLSVFIKIIPGEYDSLLSWPFEKKIRISLIDQEVCKVERVNVTKIVDFKFNKVPLPLAEPENGFGFGDFVTQSVLRTRSYLRNDNMFIMVSQA